MAPQSQKRIRVHGGQPDRCWGLDIGWLKEVGL